MSIERVAENGTVTDPAAVEAVLDPALPFTPLILFFLLVCLPERGPVAARDVSPSDGAAGLLVLGAAADER